MGNILSLGDIIDIESFQIIQDDIAHATDISIITIDYKGKPITKHSNCSAFCNHIRGIDKYSKLCEKCDSRGGLEAVRNERPYIYKCHKGLVDFAVPIIINEQYLGALMAGQILIEEQDIQLEEVCTLDMSFSDIEKEEINILKNKYERLSKFKIERVKSIANMLFHISNYIVEEALFKMKHIEANNTRQLKDNNNQKTIKDDSILKAIEYIDKNLYKNITLDMISCECNLSQSYFSKLFKKEVGVNFISYLNGKRIEKSKEMLKNTQETVNNIAINIGFEDVGYFIRVFKKNVGITPNQYRKINMCKSPMC